MHNEIMTSVCLSGDLLSLEIAARNFVNSDCFIQIDEHEDRKEFWLFSDRFDGISEKDKIKEIAEELICRINAILGFRKENFKPLKYDGCKIGDTIYIDFVDHVDLKDDLVFVDSDDRKIDIDAEFISKMNFCYEKNVTVKKILQLYLKKGVDFVNLYRIYDILKEAGIDPVKNGWTTKSTESRFTNSANNPLVSGDEARHGKITGKAPANPMNELQAKEFIDDIIQRLIESVYSKVKDEL